MFWLIRKIITLAIVVAIIFFLLNFEVGGRPLSDYALAIFHSQPVQQAIESTKEKAMNYLDSIGKRPAKPLHPQEVDRKDAGETMDPIKDDERHELEKVLNKKMEK